MSRADLEGLRETIKRIGRGASPAPSELVTTGLDDLDAALGGGLVRSALHEVFADGLLSEPASAAFAIGLAQRACSQRPVVWVRQDLVGLEMGEIHPAGLSELGLSPDRLILVRARDIASVLRAGEEAARCSQLGAVLIETWGDPKTLDLVASRRLSLAAERSNIPVLMLRAGGTPAPSAATTRWSIRTAASYACEAGAPGHPAFTAELLRARGGGEGQSWNLEWNRDRCAFTELAFAGLARQSSLSRSLVSAAAGGSHTAADHANAARRRAG